MAIWGLESGKSYTCDRAGKSSEMATCLQYLPARWRGEAMEVLGYVPTPTKNTELYVKGTIVQRMLDKGHSAREILLSHNQGNTGKCVRGTNSFGQRYDSCAYAEKGLALLTVNRK